MSASWTFGPNGLFTATWGALASSEGAPELTVTMTASGVPVQTFYADTLQQAIAQAAVNALPEPGGTMTGWLAPAVVPLAFVGSGTTTINAASGNVFALTLTASTTTLGAPSNPVDGQAIRVRVIQGSGGSFTLAYNAVYDFGTAGAPTLSTTAGNVDILGFEYVASKSKWCYLGSALGL